MPVVSVVMPVFNAAPFLGEAIESILSQTFQDFEFIIINDGSTDSSAEIIQSYNDHRIKYVLNSLNKGLVFSLNKGVNMAQGDYIARMDADDISFPARFEKQVEFLKSTGASVVASTVTMINENGDMLPPWKDDRAHITPTEIKRFLRIDNCIAHPSVMGQAAVFKKYRYLALQKLGEDYDLWLRLANEGHSISKIAEPLLFYRVLPTSFTRSKKMNVFFVLAKIKLNFFLHQATEGKLTFYTATVPLYAFMDVVKGIGKEIKAFLKK